MHTLGPLSLASNIVPDKALSEYRPLAQLLSAHASGAGDLGFNSWVGQISHSVATFLWNCVAQVLSRVDGPRYTLRRNTASMMNI